ncbi:type II secretion system minor pseudopilin GspK [Chromatiaceae bacterium AAb-1]|nr:type II secretion system minor pseudopilin GspK [Chromatiaceae bacterium AAb-1]
MKRQSGAALITVLMIIAIVMVLAVNMTGRLQLQLQRQQNIQQQQQAFWYAIGAEEFSRVLLRRTVVGQETVNLSQDWALEGATFPVDNGTISGQIQDLQSCFNLNALQQSSPAAGQQSVMQSAFQRLTELVATELSMPAEYLAARISDWIDSDTLLSIPGSAEDDDYAALLYPYYSANSLMVSETELRVILGITPADYQQLRPYICVIPEETSLQLNINTLTEDNAVLLAALIPQLDAGAAQDIIASRPEQGFGSVEELFSSSALSGITVADEVKSLLTVKSVYFRLTATTAYQESGFVLTSVLKIDGNNQVRVLARRFGGQE